MEATRVAVLMAAAAAAGAINSVAGGGSLVSFPAAVWFGMSPLVANATNTVALTPGAIASAVAYRRELAEERPLVKSLALPAALGGAVGAWLLVVTPPRIFDTVVPPLVLLATLLLLAQNLAKSEARGGVGKPMSIRLAWVGQLVVGVYGGYFGAGMGIVILALMSRIGRTDIHRMNAAKIVLGAIVNGVAAVGLVIAGKVELTSAAVMTVGATAGGFLGASVARKVDKAVIRWLVVAVGFALTAILAYRRFGG